MTVQVRRRRPTAWGLGCGRRQGLAGLSQDNLVWQLAGDAVDYARYNVPRRKWRMAGATAVICTHSCTTQPGEVEVE